MEFDEYDYLEKTVEVDTETNKDLSSNKTKRSSEKSYRKRDEEYDVEDERRRRRSKGGDENRGGERRERERDRSSRHKEVERREMMDRERSRSRERERSRSRRSRSRERESSKSRRSRSRSRRSRSRERSRSRRYESDRDREREIREREFEMRESRRSKEKKEVAEPEADPERDQRTVFAYQMPLKATERDVYEFFSRAGKVRDVRLIMDRNSRRSKGVGWNNNAIMMRADRTPLHSCFYQCMLRSQALSGQLLLGQPVMVKPSEAEKNLVQSNTSGGTSTTGQYGATDRKLYVGNLHFSITEVQLRQIFEPFGPVELVQLPLDLETGHCKGFGFIQFAQLEHAKAAQSLNGKLEIAGRLIKISCVADHVGGQDTAVKAADLDDDEGGGLSLNAQSRALLMQKLDRSGITTSMGGPLGVSGVNGTATTQPILPVPITTQPAVPSPVLPGHVPAQVTEPVGNPSECLLLRNMFDPATETEPDFDLDIKEDVEEECSKYGCVNHIYVDKHSAGYVYLRFDSVNAAAKAHQALHMRWFARRLISALFMQPHEYEAKFKGLC